MRARRNCGQCLCSRSDLRAADIMLGRNPNCLGSPETMVRFVAAICLCLSRSVGWEVTHRWLTGGSWCRKVNVALCPSETACDPNPVPSLRAVSLHLARTSCCSRGTEFRSEWRTRCWPEPALHHTAPISFVVCGSAAGRIGPGGWARRHIEPRWTWHERTRELELPASHAGHQKNVKSIQILD